MEVALMFRRRKCLADVGALERDWVKWEPTFDHGRLGCHLECVKIHIAAARDE